MKRKPLPLLTESHLVHELHPFLNDNIDISKMRVGNGTLLWWQCQLGHDWQSTTSNRSKGNNCPFCGNKKLLVGFNDLQTRNPKLSSEWHPHLNGDLSPDMILASYRDKVWWLGSCSHEWQSTVISRSGGQIGCPYCAGQKTLFGFNDVASKYPNLVKEFDKTKNTTFSLEEVSIGSHKKAWWICSKGHQWEATIKNRCKGGGCPYCAGQKVFSGDNDLATLFPEIAAEWHPILNGALTPSLLRPGHSQPVWWRCKYNHEWRARPSDRTSGGNCPTCVGFVSTEENNLRQWLIGLGIVVQQRVKRYTAPYELDIYLPDHKFAIEYNGLYWHSEANGKAKHYHKNKVEMAKTAGIQLLQVWEDDWRDKQEIIKRMILHKLNMSAERKVYGRDTKVVTITSSQASVFFEENHIQGSCRSSIYLGLVDSSSKLVAAIAFRKMPDEVAYLDRYATSCVVVGGFSKLMKAVRLHLQSHKIVTFADSTVSNGELYERNGFVKDEELPPDYCYLYKNQRVHKFNFRIKRFRSDDNLVYRDGLTESQLAQLNKLHRIWDAGKTRYVLDWSLP